MKIKIVLAIILLFTLMHLALIANLVPAQIAWGGNLERNANFYIAEILVLMLNALLIGVLLMKAGRLRQLISEKAMRVLLWCYTVLFILNTLGNLLANTWIEKSFAIFTLALVILLWQINRQHKHY